MDKVNMIKDIDSIKFKKTNGRILRTINVLEGEYTNLDIVFSVLSKSVRNDEFHRSTVFLQKAGYLEIRNEQTKEFVSSEDIVNKHCEATLTADGIRLAMGLLTDEAVEM